VEGENASRGFVIGNLMTRMAMAEIPAGINFAGFTAIHSSVGPIRCNGTWQQVRLVVRIDDDSRPGPPLARSLNETTHTRALSLPDSPNLSRKLLARAATTTPKTLADPAASTMNK